MNENEKKDLLAIAWRSIKEGLVTGKPIQLEQKSLPPVFLEKRATFVTLEKARDLRGCIGSLLAHRALAVDVANNAFAAAFEDTRFPPVRDTELTSLSLRVSLLTKPTKISFSSETDLLLQLVPFADGLILTEGFRRATFLPAVWESLPEPRQFLSHLKMKAGLPANYWSATIQFERYGSEMID